jgi:hypothetical protein
MKRYLHRLQLRFYFGYDSKELSKQLNTYGQIKPQPVSDYPVG